MKKFLLLLCITLFLFGNTKAADVFNEVKIDKLETSFLKESKSIQNDFNKKTFKKETKSLKIKSVFKKLNPFKKHKELSDMGKFIIAFILGFLLGIIGILIAFLIFLKNENRKQIMRFAWLGWLWWLVILSIILLAV